MGHCSHCRSFLVLVTTAISNACLPVGVVHEQSQFYFLFLFLVILKNSICTSDARTLGGFSRKTSRLLLAKTKERIS